DGGIEGLVLLEEVGYSGMEEYRAEVIRDAKSLGKVYAQINKTRKPGLPVPIVDFSKEMVIMVGLGNQNGDKVILSKAGENDDEIIINVQIMGADDAVRQQPIPQTVYLYKLPITEKTVHFIK